MPSRRPNSTLDRPFLPWARKVHGAEPHPHRQLGTLENGASDQRCLVSAVSALEQLTLADLTILCCRAPRTLEALRPAPSEPRPPRPDRAARRRHPRGPFGAARGCEALVPILK